MNGKTMQIKKRVGAFSLVLVILLTVLFGTNEGLPSAKTFDESKSEVATLTGGACADGNIESVDEINTAVYHAVLLRRLSHKQVQQILRICVRLFLLAGVAIIILFVMCCLQLQRHQSRTILIRFIHRSDGKK